MDRRSVHFLYGFLMYGARNCTFDIERPPDNAINMYVVGKQWMWKIQHPEGQREINELHIPVGRPVKLTMTSEDVIHSFFVPAFRTKQDVLPGRYTMTWFEATKPGKYHLFCSQYCGTKHSGMIGWIYAMTSVDYQNWLTQGAPEGSLASDGEKYFHQFGCANCHHFGRQGRGPDLRNLYMRPVLLTTGQTIIADDSYIREKLRDPDAQVPWGFSAGVMPNFTGVVSEEQILALISYIKALGPQPGTQEPSSPAPLPRNTERKKELAGPALHPTPVRRWRSADMIQAVADKTEKNYLNEKQGILSWLLTTDHKRIGILYTFSITGFFFLGGFFALMMRLELLFAAVIGWSAAETYNKLFTMHGIIMVWFFLIPSIPNTLGNFLIPMMVGRQRSGLSETELTQLVCVYAGRRLLRFTLCFAAALTPAGRFIRRSVPLTLQVT